jgi:hypothetical protein
MGQEANRDGTTPIGHAGPSNRPDFATGNLLETKHRKISNRGQNAHQHFAVCADFTPKQSPPCIKESASRDASEQGKIPLNAQNEREPS